MLARLALSALPLLASLARAAPTPLDAATLRQNAQDAQRLNALYPTLALADVCTDGQKACVGGVPTLCRDGAWAPSRSGCPDRQYCFALPSVRVAGTVVACTSEASAESIFSAYGALGGTDGAVSAANGAAAPNRTHAASPIAGPHPQHSLTILNPSATVPTAGSASSGASAMVTTTVTLDPSETTTAASAHIFVLPVHQQYHVSFAM